MASVASQLIEEITAHAQSDSLDNAREICVDDTYFPNNLRTYIQIHIYIRTYMYTYIHIHIHTYLNDLHCLFWRRVKSQWSLLPFWAVQGSNIAPNCAFPWELLCGFPEPSLMTVTRDPSRFLSQPSKFIIRLLSYQVMLHFWIHWQHR